MKLKCGLVSMGRGTLSVIVIQGSKNTVGDWKVLAGNKFHALHLGDGFWDSAPNSKQSIWLWSLTVHSLVYWWSL